MDTESLAFKAWARNEGLVQHALLSDFSDAQLGIDAEDYLNTRLTDAQTREPLLPALGGLPFALRQHIDADLENFQKAGITPSFVFNGLDLACKDRRSVARESQKAVNLLDEAWRVYDLGHGDDAVVAFGKACTYRTTHIARYLLFYLQQKGVHTMVAPYTAAAQLAHLERENFCWAISGSASVLVFGAERVIVNFDWENKKVAFISRDHALTKLGMNMNMFVDLCLLAGSSILSTMPEIDKADPAASRMTLARGTLARSGNDGLTACIQAKDEEYTALFRKAKAAVRFVVIVWPNGELKPLDFDNSFSDTHEIVSQRLPDEIFAYHQHGMIASRILNWRTRQEIFETPPLDGGSSQAYKDLVQKGLRPLRARTLAILTTKLHRYFTKQDVDLVCWFNENDKRALGLPDVQLNNITNDAETWHVRDGLMSQSAQAKRIDLRESPLQYCIALLSDESLAKKTVTKRKDGEHSILTKSSELMANILWRFLQDRGYINSDHTLSAWGKALKAAFERASSDGYLGKTDPPREAEEAIFVAFELLRLEVLSTKNMFLSPPYLGAPQRGTDVDKANVLLLSRIASLASFQHDAIGYTGPLSRHLLAFQQMAAAVRGSLRDLAEVHGSYMMLSGSAVRLRDNADYADVATHLPFTKEPDLGLALVVKSHLDELSQDVGRRADIRKWFNHAQNIDEDLQKAWKMWDAINAGVQAADSAIVSSETKNTFQGADEWLRQKRKAPTSHVNGTNGTT